MKQKSDGSSQKPDGWFSRRHQTRSAHVDASAAYLAEHGRQARQLKAAERVAATVPGLSHRGTRGHLLGRCSCPGQVSA